MKKTLLIVFIAAALVLASCAQSNASPSQTASAQPTMSVVSAAPANLPDPGSWASSLSLSEEDYPRVDGSTATIPLAVYMRSKITGESLEDSTANTAFSTTGPSYIALSERRADLLVVYEAPEEVKSDLKSRNADFIQKPVGLDALVFLTNEGNNVSTLTEEQIIDIYTGKTTNWKDVGGADTDIIPYQRVSNSGSQALMLKLVMKGTKMMEAPSMLKPGEMGELIDDLASYDNTSNALGYSVYYYVRNMYQVPGIKMLAVGGVDPCPETITSGQYPYINPFYAVIRADEPADSPARRLFDWLTGGEGARAVGDSGYVPVK